MNNWMRWALVPVSIWCGACAGATEPETADEPLVFADGKADRLDDASCDAAAEPFGAGEGTEASPYLICSNEQLGRVAGEHSFRHFRLAASLDVTGQPVRAMVRFAGTFDGGGREIRGLSADGSAGHAAWVLENYGVIENLSFSDANINGAAVVARDNHGVIRNVHVSGNVEWLGTEPTGAVVGRNYAVVHDVDVTGSVTSGSMAGGVVGINYHFGSITMARVDATVTGGGIGAGGIAGASHGLVAGVSVDAHVLTHAGTGLGSGGIVGILDGGHIADATAAGVVSASQDAGGLVGRAVGGSVVRASFVGSTRAGSGGGGLVGRAPNYPVFEDCLVVADIVSDHSLPPASAERGSALVSTSVLVGTLSSASDSTPVPFFGVWNDRSAWATEVAQAELADPATYRSFATDAWRLDDLSAGYPTLRWENGAPTALAPEMVRVRFVAWGSSSPEKVRVETEGGRIVQVPFFAYPGATSAFAYAMVEAGPITYSYRDQWQDRCGLDRAANAWTEPPSTRTATAEEGAEFEENQDCDRGASLPFPPLGPFLSAAPPPDGSGGEVITTYEGVVYTLAHGKLYRDGKLYTPDAFQFENHRAVVHDKRIFFLLDYPMVRPWSVNASDRPNDPVLLMGTPSLRLWDGMWTRVDGMLNVAGLEDFQIDADGYVTGNWFDGTRTRYERASLTWYSTSVEFFCPPCRD